ncbi:MAG: fibronectin type III domain-containing protein, partial [Mycobacteriaceae bacterium]|nr:fibronectin type III domain-containing protein [Mycobacteriaceae bacterium]
PLVVGGPAGPVCTTPLQIPVPAATLLPGLLTFPATTTVSGALSAELRNVGGAPMVVRNVYISGLNPTDYTITAGAGPRTMAAGARLTISVAFAPKALGLRQAFLSVDCNAANTQDLSIPLSGVGIGAQAPPAPGTPVASFSAGTQLNVAAGGAIANSLMPVRVNWAPAVSPLVTSYQLQMSVNSAPWVDTPNQPGAATSIVLGLPMGIAAAPKTYQFRVRAMNITVPGAWSVAARVGFTMVDNQNTSISYSGTWALAADLGAYGGSTRSSSAAKTATTLIGKNRFLIPGSIAWVATMGPDRGLVSVSVDKGAPVTVDLYSPTLQKAMVPFAVNVGAGAAHTITAGAGPRTMAAGARLTI